MICSAVLNPFFSSHLKSSSTFGKFFSSVISLPVKLKEVFLTGADFVKFLEKDEAFHNKLMHEAGFAAKK